MASTGNVEAPRSLGAGTWDAKLIKYDIFYIFLYVLSLQVLQDTGQGLPKDISDDFFSVKGCNVLRSEFIFQLRP